MTKVWGVLAAVVSSVLGGTSVSNLPMSFLHRFIILLQTWRQRLRERQQLAEMDDRSLRDIGLTRYDVEYELRKPFWRE
jgi:uncharacterized protein YjiS (DUF1127 family)